jgi:hypothetical protein
MVSSKFVVRLLAADDVLLAWATVMASPKRGEGGRASCPFIPDSPTQFVIEQAGVPAKLSVHWADLDVARVRDLKGMPAVQPGQMYHFGWMEPIWLVSGMRDVPLPAVTVRGPVSIAPPPAQMGMRDSRV